MTTQLTTETFAKSIQNGVSFIDFGAQWCPPCRIGAGSGRTFTGL
ncbi:partial thioredoxin [Streptococcus mutans LJ23]|nr:partial thioredoxin [Streptococcus mutans LJ23]